MRQEFDGAIFEGVLLGGETKSRGSLFGTAFGAGYGYVPVYDPLNSANIMTLPSALTDKTNILISPTKDLV